MPIYPSDLPDDLSAEVLTKAGQLEALAKQGSATNKYGLVGATLYATILFVGGAWLAHKQLPRLAGQKIEYDAPLFTKVFSSLLFAIGITGGITGAYLLARQLIPSCSKE